MFNALIAIATIVFYVFAGERFFLLALIPGILSVPGKIDEVRDAALFACHKADIIAGKIFKNK